VFAKLLQFMGAEALLVVYFVTITMDCYLLLHDKGDGRIMGGGGWLMKVFVMSDSHGIKAAMWNVN